MPAPATAVARVWANGVSKRVLRQKTWYPGTRVWHLIDARAQVRRGKLPWKPSNPSFSSQHLTASQVVGRLASQIATLLTGKHKPTYVPRLDGGDHVVVVNATEVVFTGRKWDQKLYRHHTGWPGGLKEMSARRMREKFPERILEYAVKGMLPKNTLRKQRMNRLHVYPGPEHMHEAQIKGSHRMFAHRFPLAFPQGWKPKLFVEGDSSPSHSVRR